MLCHAPLGRQTKSASSWTTSDAWRSTQQQRQRGDNSRLRHRHAHCGDTALALALTCDRPAERHKAQSKSDAHFGVGAHREILHIITAKIGFIRHCPNVLQRYV